MASSPPPDADGMSADGISAPDHRAAEPEGIVASGALGDDDAQRGNEHRGDEHRDDEHRGDEQRGDDGEHRIIIATRNAPAVAPLQWLPQGHIRCVAGLRYRARHRRDPMVRGLPGPGIQMPIARLFGRWRMQARRVSARLRHRVNKHAIGIWGPPRTRMEVFLHEWKLVQVSAKQPKVDGMDFTLALFVHHDYNTNLTAYAVRTALGQSAHLMRSLA